MVGGDYFALLGIPRVFAIDEAVLDANYRERSKEVHPDRHVQADAGTRAAAVGDTMDLNKAYKALRKPGTRAEHLLGLYGVQIESNESLDASFLAEILELREELDAAIAAKNAEKLEQLEESMLDRRDALISRVASSFAAVEETPANVAPLDEIKRALIELRYVVRYLEQFDDLEEAA